MPVAVAADRRFRRAHLRPPRRRHAWTRVIPLVRAAVAVACFAAVIGALVLAPPEHPAAKEPEAQ